MSDTSQGEGWWLAPDSKWYPPEVRAPFADEPGAPNPDPSPATASPPAPVAADATAAVPTEWAPPALAPPDRSLVRNPVFVTTVVVILFLAAVGGAVYAIVGGSSGSTSSTQSVASATVGDLSSGHFAQICSLASPGQAAQCASDVKELTADRVKYTDLAVGAVTVDGNRAVFAMTGSVCVGTSGRCFSNRDANLGKDKGQTFDQMYAIATGTTNGSPFLLPIVLRGGRWYVTGF